MLAGQMPFLTFSIFYLYHITTFKVGLNSTILYKKGAKFRMDNCCFDRCLNDSYHAVEVDSEVF